MIKMNPTPPRIVIGIPTRRIRLAGRDEPFHGAFAAYIDALHAVGAGVLLGSTIFRDPVGKMFAGEYDVTGSWVEPRVERLGGAKAGAPAANNGVSR